MNYAYTIYGLMIIIELVIFLKLFKVAKNFFIKETLSINPYIFQGLSLIFFGFLVALLSFKLAQMPPKELHNWVESLMSFWRTHRIWLIWTMVISALGVLTMGLLGMVLIPFCDVVVEIIMKLEPMHGDSVWPVAIVYSVFLPWLALIVYLIWHRFLVAKGCPVSVMICILVALILLIHLVVRIKTGESRT